jgi:hypothetical protein
MIRDHIVIQEGVFNNEIVGKLNKSPENRIIIQDNYTLNEGAYTIKEDIEDSVKERILKILKAISFLPFLSFGDIVEHIRDLNKKYTLVYAHNGTGKTRLSMAFRQAGKTFDADGNVTARDTLYFNAFTEDLFSWDNDLDNDAERRLLINKYSAFVSGVRELDMENKIRPLIHRYSNFNFLIDYDYKDREEREFWAVNFIREEIINETPQNKEFIKISRGEENLFIWCFFLAVAQFAIDKQAGYEWVKYIYIDDPVSSLDDNNTIALAHHLSKMLKIESSEVKTVISTHHGLFFNVLCNELKNGQKFFLSKSENSYWLKDTTDSPFFYHVSLIQSIEKAIIDDQLHTYHFNVLRTILEKAANFHGFNGFQDCLIVNDDDEEHTLHTRMINIFNHGSYSLFEPIEMGEENKGYFRQIFENFKGNYKFNKELFEETTTAGTA